MNTHTQLRSCTHTIRYDTATGPTGGRGGRCGRPGWRQERRAQARRWRARARARSSRHPHLKVVSGSLFDPVAATHYFLVVRCIFVPAAKPHQPWAPRRERPGVPARRRRTLSCARCCYTREQHGGRAPIKPATPAFCRGPVAMNPALARPGAQRLSAIGNHGQETCSQHLMEQETLVNGSQI
jgi:hypothetical protein